MKKSTSIIPDVSYFETNPSYLPDLHDPSLLPQQPYFKRYETCEFSWEAAIPSSYNALESVLRAIRDLIEIIKLKMQLPPSIERDKEVSELIEVIRKMVT